MSMFSRTKTTTPTDFEQATQAVADITGDYTLDVSHTRLGFSARHAMVTTVRGQFQEFTGTRPHRHREPRRLHGRGDHPGRQHRHRQRRPRRPPGLRRLLRRGEQPRDHLRLHRGRARPTRPPGSITGDLTIKGVTKPVTIEFEQTGSAQDPFGNLRVGFEGSTAINRKDWGLTWNAALETGGVLVSEQDQAGLRHLRDPVRLIRTSSAA